MKEIKALVHRRRATDVVKKEVVRADAQVGQVLTRIRTQGRSRHASAWVYLSDIEQGVRLDFALESESPHGT